MTSDSDIRASDSDREQVVEILREAYAAGRLTLEEFDERSSAAFAGRTWGALRELTTDLPQQARLGLDLPAPGPAAPAAVKAASRDRMPPRRRLAPVLPILVLWLGMALAARDPAALIPVLVFLAMALRLAGRPSRPHDHTGHDHTGHDHTGHDHTGHDHTGDPG